MNEDKIKKELNNLDKIKAPRNFLYQIHSRIEEKPMPFTLSLKLASTVATLIIIFSVYKVMQPNGQISLMEKKKEVKVAAARSSMSRMAKTKGVVAKKSAKPKFYKMVELDLFVKAEDDMAVAGAAMAPAASSRGVGLKVSEPVKADNSSAEKLKYIISLVNGKIIGEKPQVIAVDIPVEKYDSFMNMISQLGDMKKPAKIVTGNKKVRFRIQLIPQK
jgi:hypothetical protein